MSAHGHGHHHQHGARLLTGTRWPDALEIDGALSCSPLVETIDTDRLTASGVDAATLARCVDVGLWPGVVTCRPRRRRIRSQPASDAGTRLGRPAPRATAERRARDAKPWRDRVGGVVADLEHELPPLTPADLGVGLDGRAPRRRPAADPAPARRARSDPAGRSSWSEDSGGQSDAAPGRRPRSSPPGSLGVGWRRARAASSIQRLGPGLP